MTHAYFNSAACLVSAQAAVLACVAYPAMQDSLFDRKLNWILDKLKATNATYSDNASHQDTDRLARDETADVVRFTSLPLTKRILRVLLFRTLLFTILLFVSMGLVGSWLIVLRALEVGEYDGQQWRRAAVLAVQTTAYIFAVALPGFGLLILYGPFLAKVCGRDLPASLKSLDIGISPIGILFCLLWEVAWAFLVPMLMASAIACALARLFDWPSACRQLFCSDLQLRDLSQTAASFAAAGAFFAHCLSWWHACFIPLPRPLACCRFPMLQRLSSTTLLSKGFSIGLPIFLGFCFLFYYEQESPLDHFTFTLGCLTFVGLAGACSRLCARNTRYLQPWQKVLVSLTCFACFGVAVAFVRMMSASQEMLRTSPPSMLAACLHDGTGPCSTVLESTVRPALHARFFLLAVTAFPACCGLAWEALRPDFLKAEAGGGHDWLSKMLVPILAAGIIGSMWGLSIFREESEPLAAEILFFLFTGLLSCYVLRQLHWRVYFWVKFRRDPATAKNPYHKFVVAEFDSTASLRRHRVSQPRLITGECTKVLHLQKPLESWPSFSDVPSRVEAVAMSMQCTVVPFYHISSWRKYMSELGNKCNKVPFLAHHEVMLLASVSLVFLIGKVCLLLFVMLAPIHLSDAYVHYSASQDIVGDMYDHALSVGGPQKVSVEGYVFGFVWIVYDWWLGNSALYRLLFTVVVAACSVLVVCWRWTGLFTLVDAGLHALALFVIVDAEVRKVIILRDANLEAQCWHGVGIAAWVQRTATFLFFFGVPALQQAWNLGCACWQMRGHVVLYDLLAKSLVPPPANVLLVSAANLPYSMQQNDCILDYQIFRFVTASATTVVTLLAAPGAAAVSDVISFIAQALLTIKGPLEAYAFRLKRIGTIARALSESHPVDYEPLTFEDAETCPGPQMRYFSDVPTWWCGNVRFYEAMSAANVGFIPKKSAKNQHSRKSLTSATLGVGEKIHIDIGQDKVWATSRLLRSRLAVSVQFTEEPSLWAFWTLEVSGHRTCYRQDVQGGRGP